MGFYETGRSELTNDRFELIDAEYQFKMKLTQLLFRV